MTDARARGFLWFALMVGILALAAFGVFLGRAEAVTTWAPTWSTLAADWQTVTQACAQPAERRFRATSSPKSSAPAGPQLVMRCQSGGLVSNRTWSRAFALDARATVSATAVSGQDYFAGLTIYDAQSGDTVYGELALGKLVPPFQGINADIAGALVDESFTWYQPTMAGQPHTLDVLWQPSGWWIFSLDGQQVAQHAGALGHDPAIFLLCVSVGEGTPDDGSLAECRFSNLSVTGVESGEVRRLWLPVSQGQGYPK